ncbi:MAG TPA: polysaccharide deacetylase family protein [Solirubrobacterales bacterium]|nr:polysaccharide deacetylase family protein [Solirubrobacterales bacterium]
MPPALPQQRDFPISTARKIPLIAGLAAALGLSAPAGPALAASPAVPVRAGLSQAGRRLILSVRTSKPLALAQLARQPRDRDAFLCFELSGGGKARRLCVGGRRKRATRAGLTVLNAAGEVTARESVTARLKRPEPDKLVLALLPQDAGLAPGHYSWRVVVRRRGCQPRPADRCESSLPGKGERPFRLRPVRAVGCTGGSAGLVTNGPRDRNVVALTFDDGPSEYTPGFLGVLHEKHVPGTFFEIGQEMSRYPQTMREILREGNEIGNHTTHHTEFPGYAEIAPTTELTERITHFRPCLFRPPGGAVDSSVIAAAGEDGLLSVTWDVDPADWANPGSGAVYSRIVDAARPGSIILMHDGGGDRSGTLAALPSIIDTLRARGYRFATVTELLGHRMVYKPYG